MILQITDAELYALERASQKRGETVRIDTQALRNLLAGHFALNLEVKRRRGAMPQTKGE